MPLYEMECQTCQHITEVIRPIDDRDLPCVCEVCGKETKRISVSKNMLVLWVYPGGAGRYPVSLGPTENVYRRVPEQKRKEATRHHAMYKRQPGDSNKAPGSEGVTGPTVKPPPPGFSKLKE